MSNERLPLIDAAIEDLDGKFPPTAIGYSGRGYYAKGDMANILHKINFGDVCTREEFEHRKAELQNKPSWEDALEWANWLAQDANGSWYWWERKPELSFKAFDDDEGFYFRCSKGGKVIGNWQDTLEQRPAATKKEQNMNDNWNGNGDPEVGQRLFYLGGNEEREAIVLGVHKDESDDTVIWHKPVDGLYKGGKCFSVDSLCFFRPLRTETDKLVEQMERSFESTGCVFTNDHRALAEHLVEQGYRKIKPMTEDEFVKQAWDECGAFKQAAELLYRAGCRFIEQVEV